MAKLQLNIDVYVFKNFNYITGEQTVCISCNCSVLAEHGLSLHHYFNKNFPGLVKIHRSNIQLGLIKARQLGARLATGDVIVCMDSHVEVQRGW